MNRVLLCDTDKEVMEAVSFYLEQEGYQVYKAYDGEEAVEIINKEQIQLLITDLELPKLDGLHVILKIRENNSLPIIILSGKSSEQDKIQGLNAGADDYVTKPCSILELIARVKSQLRRYMQLRNISQEIAHIYKVDDLVINDDTRKVTVGGKDVRLTPIEYKILTLLVKDKGKVYSIEQIYETIWNMRAIGADNTIAVHIRHIREKIENNPKEPKYLKVVWGTGYKVG